MIEQGWKERNQRGKKKIQKKEQEKTEFKKAVNGSGHCICILRSGVDRRLAIRSWRMDAGVSETRCPSAGPERNQ